MQRRWLFMKPSPRYSRSFCNGTYNMSGIQLYKLLLHDRLTRHRRVHSGLSYIKDLPRFLHANGWSDESIR